MVCPWKHISGAVCQYLENLLYREYIIINYTVQQFSLWWGRTGRIIRKLLAAFKGDERSWWPLSKPILTPCTNTKFLLLITYSCPYAPFPGLHLHQNLQTLKWSHPCTLATRLWACAYDHFQGNGANINTVRCMPHTVHAYLTRTCSTVTQGVAYAEFNITLFGDSLRFFPENWWKTKSRHIPRQ